MFDISNTLKCAAIAGVVGVAAIALGTGTAAARSYTDCDGDSCVRVHCDWSGDNCWRESVYYNPGIRDYHFDRGYYGGYVDRHWTCDAYGDNCRWVPD